MISDEQSSMRAYDRWMWIMICCVSVAWTTSCAPHSFYHSYSQTSNHNPFGQQVQLAQDPSATAYRDSIHSPSVRVDHESHHHSHKNFRLPNGVWIDHTPSSEVYRSTDSMNEAMISAKSLGVNAIYPSVWNKQQFFFNSSTVTDELDESFITTFQDNQDILAALAWISDQHNLDIYPSLSSGLKIVMRQEGRETKTKLGTLISQRDHWLSLDKDGEVVEMCQFDVCFAYLNLLNTQVRQFHLRLATELIQNYDIDGLMYDDHFSLPAPVLGCDPLLSTNPHWVNEFESFKNHKPFWNLQNESALCAEFLNIIRRRLITDHFKNIHELALKHDKKILLSPAGTPRWSRQDWLQDWGTLVKKQIVDGVIMQVFRGATFSLMVHSPEVTRLQQNHPHVPIGIVILLGMRHHHKYATGERIARQTHITVSADKPPSFWYHEMIHIPTKGRNVEDRMKWINQVRTMLLASRAQHTP